MKFEFSSNIVIQDLHLGEFETKNNVPNSVLPLLPRPRLLRFTRLTENVINLARYRYRCTLVRDSPTRMGYNSGQAESKMDRVAWREFPKFARLSVINNLDRNRIRNRFRLFASIVVFPRQLSKFPQRCLCTT